jgi:hypothetical protein
MRFGEEGGMTGLAEPFADAHEPLGVAQNVGTRPPGRRVPVSGQEGSGLGEKRVRIGLGVVAGNRRHAVIAPGDHFLPTDPLDRSLG